MPEPHPVASPQRPYGAEYRPRSMSNLTRPSNPSPSPLIQKDQWLKAAHESTEHFKAHGSPLPLVWVLTEGNYIPPNAVPFSEDANGCPLYIARALLEGHLHLGRAGGHLQGATIAYSGREVSVSKYEVLVCASQLRWGFPTPEANGVLQSGTVVLSQQRREQSRHASVHVESFNTSLRSCDVLRYIPPDNHRDAALKRLAEIKTVILVDDSISMTEGNLWLQAREALGGIVDIANRHGPKGIDLHFMHQEGHAENLHSRDDVARLFDEVQPNGEDTPTGAKLAQVIEHYLPFIEPKESRHEPITIIVITDGAATDHDELVRCIVETAHRLDNSGVRQDRFGIQFVQIGTDEAAAEALRALDDNLEETYKIRDIVDTTPFNPEQGVFDTEYMLKILLGGLRKDLDNNPILNTPTSMLAAGTHRGSPRSLTSTLGGAPAKLGSPVMTPTRRLSLKTLPKY